MLHNLDSYYRSSACSLWLICSTVVLILLEREDHFLLSFLFFADLSMIVAVLLVSIDWTKKYLMSKGYYEIRDTLK